MRPVYSPLLQDPSAPHATSGTLSTDGSIRSASHSVTNDVVFALAAKHLTVDSTVLDLGAGKGYMSRRLGQWFAKYGGDPGRRVIACDVDSSCYTATEIPFRKFDANRGLPFGDATFDLIVAIEVFEHVDNVYRQFDECIRVLKDDGLLIISVPNIGHLMSRLKFFLTGFYDLYMPPSSDPKNAGRICGHIMPLTLAYLSYGLRRAGFHRTVLHTDRAKKAAAILTAVLYPLIGCSSWFYRRKVQRYDASVFAENDLVIQQMNGWRMLTARSCIIAATK